MTGNAFPSQPHLFPARPNPAHVADSRIKISSLRCIQVLAGVLGKAGQEGQLLRREAAEDGEVTYIPHRKLSTGISKGR